MNKKFPHIMAIGTEVLWAFSYLSMKVIVEEINPIQAALYRYILASIVLAVIFFAGKRRVRIHKEDRLTMLLLGLTGIALYFAFENVGVKYTTTANVALILATIPVFTLIIENKKNKVETPFTQLVGVVLSIIGIAMIILVKEKISFDLSNSFGDLMILMASLSWVAYTFLIGRLKGDYDGVELTFYTTISGTIFLLPSLIFTGVHPLSTGAFIHLLYLAVICSGVAFVMYLYSLKILGPITVNTYINVQPVVSVLISIFIIKETIYPAQYFGSVLIIIGVYLVSTYSKYKSKKEMQTTKVIE